MSRPPTFPRAEALVLLYFVGATSCFFFLFCAFPDFIDGALLLWASVPAATPSNGLTWPRLSFLSPVRAGWTLLYCAVGIGLLLLSPGGSPHSTQPSSYSAVKQSTR